MLVGSQNSKGYTHAMTHLHGGLGPIQRMGLHIDLLAGYDKRQWSWMFLDLFPAWEVRCGNDDVRREDEIVDSVTRFGCKAQETLRLGGGDGDAPRQIVNLQMGYTMVIWISSFSSILDCRNNVEDQMLLK